MLSAARRRPRRVPAGAEERDLEASAGTTSADFFVGGRRVARIHWHESGAPEWEQYFDERGRRHGVELYRHESGRIKWQTSWVRGVQHGWTRQWAEDGALLSETRFVRGTGVDVWCDGRDGLVSEVRQWRDGNLDGLEQWWSDAKHVWLEGRWAGGREHGIWREWNAGSRLRRGFPRYFVRGEKVTRREYERAAARDPSLPPYRKIDDRTRRELPSDAARALVGMIKTRRARP